MPISGTDFEVLVKPFFRELFEKMGFEVFEVRNQKSGTQNGFDIKVIFQDETGIDRNIFIECKYYESILSFTQIVKKILELGGANYNPDVFIALSPKVNLSNQDDNLKEQLQGIYKFPCEFWTPDSEVEKMFALDPALYQKVYDQKPDLEFDHREHILKLKNRIIYNIGIKETLAVSHLIKIGETDKIPEEDDNLKTTLDEKLNAVLDPKNPHRIKYHQIRCDYKVYLEDLVDTNNLLRGKILSWQEDLRLKAYRLSEKFRLNANYDSLNFFHDFFSCAEEALKSFYKSNNLGGDEEKLLHGVVLELAAECPLDWRKPT